MNLVVCYVKAVCSLHSYWTSALDPRPHKMPSQLKVAMLFLSLFTDAIDAYVCLLADVCVSTLDR